MSLRDQLLEIANMGTARLDETHAETLSRIRRRLIAVTEASWRELKAERLLLEDADALDRCAEDADDNQWDDWAATMRQAAERIRLVIQ